jgi:hypothetical protein
MKREFGWFVVLGVLVAAICAAALVTMLRG